MFFNIVVKHHHKKFFQVGQYVTFLLITNFVFITLPLFLLGAMLKARSGNIRGMLDALEWNLADMKKKGILLGASPGKENTP